MKSAFPEQTRWRESVIWQVSAHWHSADFKAREHGYRATIAMRSIDKEFEREVPWDEDRRPLLLAEPDDQMSAFIHECFRAGDTFRKLMKYRWVVSIRLYKSPDDSSFRPRLR